MPIRTTFTFPRYLDSKRSVDDRALNRHVLGSFSRTIESLPVTPLRVLEVGAGIGTMIERCLEWELFPDRVRYTAIDASSENIAAAHSRLRDWASRHAFTITERATGLFLASHSQQVEIALEAVDLFELLRRDDLRASWDILIAHAFLDLFDIPGLLPDLLRVVTPAGLLYFTINFDGVTILEPVIDAIFDQHVLSLYHRTMDERITDGRPSGDSQAGRHLFQHLHAAGADILDAGSSDWVVFANQGAYPNDEAYFLHFIVHTIHDALRHHAEIDSQRFTDWIEQRHAQIKRGELVYIAHQLDFLARVAPPA